MGERVVYKDILLRAACRVGSSAELAQRLQVSRDRLRAWMRGDDDPPARMVLLALVILESGNDAVGTAAVEARNPAGIPLRRVAGQ